MIYFITNCEKHIERFNSSVNVTTLKSNMETFNFIIDSLQDLDIIGFDKETNGLDANVNSTILDIIGSEQSQFVFHSYFDTIFPLVINWIIKEKKCLIGHNLKFDLGFLYTELNINYKGRLYDVMIAEQRIYMGITRSNALLALCGRYVLGEGQVETEMDKSIREEFIGANSSKFQFRHRHITYAAGDIDKLETIRLKQKVKLDQYKLNFLVYNIEFPLVHILAKAEVTGFPFDLENWLKVYNENKEKVFELECLLDRELLRLRDRYAPNTMKNSKWETKRIKNDAHALFNDDGTTNMLDLFGEPMKINSYFKAKNTKIVKNPNNVQFTSDAQIVEIFAHLKQPLLTEQKVYVTPKFNKKGKIDKTRFNFRTNEKAMQEYLAEYPESIMRPFILLLLEHRSYSTACNNFGIKYKSKINPVTGNIHTVFRQCFAKTGRFQSGGGQRQQDKPNFQNIPSKAKYAKRLRNCFKARKGYSIGTHDLSGAELIIMCSLSQDMKLLEVSKGDMHSYVAQGSFREVYKHRAKQKEKLFGFGTLTEGQINAVKDEIQKLKDLSENFIVNKSTPYRTPFKPVTFGVVYGMYALKLLKSLVSELAKAGVNMELTLKEAEIILKFIKTEFPDVMRMVERNSRFAKKHGYLICNRRTNSRAWFPRILDVLNGRIHQDDQFKYMMNELNQAKNKAIQSTQADMIKEMTVDLQHWIYDNGYEDEITILSWVHDEIIDEHPKYLDGRSDEWKEWRKNDNVLVYNSNIYHDFPELKAQIMRDTANRYLINVEMDADYEVEPYWTK